MSVYNTPSDILERCINSIYVACLVTGFYKETEVLICDDGSTEQDTIDTLHKLIDKYSSNMKLFTNDINRGVSYSLNKLISAAQGKYIAQMDSDDFMLPNRLKIQYFHLENNTDLTGSFTNTYNYIPGFTDKEKLQDAYNTQLIVSSPKEYAEKGYSGGFHPTFFYRKEDIVNNNIKYNEDYIVAHDHDFIFNILSHHLKIQFLRNKLVAYLKHKNSLTIIKKELGGEEYLKIYDKYIGQIKKEEQ